MIVQPDFLDHWKTQLLIDILDDELAPMYVIRLWAHCQNRKTQTIPNGNPSVTKAICRAVKHDAEKFHSAMIESGFIEVLNGDLIAHDWNDVNSSLIRNWNNGRLGGRPKKKNPEETQLKPKDNPVKTPSKPIREEKSRLDKKTSTGDDDGVFKISEETFLKNPEYDMLVASDKMRPITIEQYVGLKHIYPHIDHERTIRECLACTVGMDDVEKPFAFLKRFFGNAPEKQRPVVAQDIKGCIVC